MQITSQQGRQVTGSLLLFAAQSRANPRMRNSVERNLTLFPLRRLYQEFRLYDLWDHTVEERSTRTETTLSRGWSNDDRNKANYVYADDGVSGAGSEYDGPEIK